MFKLRVSRHIINYEPLQQAVISAVYKLQRCPALHE